MIPMCVSSDPYRDTYMENGVPAPAWEGAGLAAGTLLGPTIEAYMVPKYADSQQGGPTAYDQTFWNDRDHLVVAEDIVATGIPALIWNGWNDSGFGGLELYSALQNASFHPDRALLPMGQHDPVTGRYQLLLGDWGHGGGLDQGIELQWYETWLKHVDTGLDVHTKTPLHVQDRTTKAWSNLSAYPMVRTYTPLYLAPGGQLQAAPPATAGADSLAWGPSEQGGNSVTYTSDPLDRIRTIAGPSAVRVVATSSNANIQLRGDLYDVAPDGTAVPITHGGILGSMRAPDAARTWSDRNGLPVRPFLALTGEVPVPAGQAITYDIPLQPTVWTLLPQHRVKLRIASQADQQVCIQKQTAITIDAVGCRPRAADMATLAGGQYTVSLGPSLLSLPLREPLRVVPSVPAPGRPVALPTDW
jgi:predicted acyl esterase